MFKNDVIDEKVLINFTEFVSLIINKCDILQSLILQ